MATQAATRAAGWRTPQLWLAALSPARQRVVAATLGVALTLGFAPWHVWPVAVPALVGLFWLVCAAGTVRQALVLGWWFGFGHFFTSLIWIAVAFQFQANMPVWIGVIAVVLLAGFLAGYSALLAAGVRASRWQGLPAALLFAALWGLAEGLRGVLFTGFPWNPLATVWIGFLPAAQGAALLGAYGWSMVTVLWALLFGLGGWRGPVAALALGGVAVAGGAWWMATTPQPEGRPVRLHLVQANVPQEIKWSTAMARDILHRHIDLSRRALSTHGPGVVIWPETAVANIIEEEPSTRFLIRRLLPEGAMLLTGGLRVVRDDEGWAVAAKNSLLALDSEGRVEATYDKSHLVPFGEYLPFRPLLEAIGLSRLAPGGMDFSRGPGARTLTLSAAPPVGPLICYEVIFPGKVVERGRRPAWLLNISNDAWFGRSTGPPQHLAQAQLRAIEQGLPMVRVTPTGYTAVIDSSGRVVAQLPTFAEGALSADLPASRRFTAYSLVLHGGAIGLGLVFLTIGGLLRYFYRRQ
jgi:apolipoprotein N-acyltransferase